MIIAFFDGSGTTGMDQVCFGYRIFKNGELYSEGSSSEVVEESSNNVAEYAGLIHVLKVLLEDKLQDEVVMVYGDSQLVINQMFRGWRMRGGIYKSKALEAQELVKKFRNITGHWVEREQMREVDKLARELWQNVKAKQKSS